jgi:hypothetical protein
MYYNKKTTGFRRHTPFKYAYKLKLRSVNAFYYKNYRLSSYRKILYFHPMHSFKNYRFSFLEIRFVKKYARIDPNDVHVYVLVIFDDNGHSRVNIFFKMRFAGKVF